MTGHGVCSLRMVSIHTFGLGATAGFGGGGGGVG